MNTVELLKQFKIPENKPLREFPIKGLEICALTGETIIKGIAVQDILSDAIAKPYEVFKYKSDFVGVDAGKLYQWFRGGLVGNVFASKGMAIKPMVSRDSAKKADRLCWIDLIKKLKKGEETVAIFSQESKNRLWINSTVGIVGKFWDVYLNDGSFNGILTVDHSKLLHCIEICEKIYAFGCNKTQIRTNVMDIKTARALSKKQKVSIVDIIKEMQEIESEIKGWRATSEFKLCLFIIQPPE